MLLTLPERFAVLTVLPTEANYATLRIMHELRIALSPTEAEFEQFGIEPVDGGGLSWDPAKTFDANGEPIEIEIVIGRKAEAIIVESLEKLDGQKKLTDRQFSIYGKFVQDNGEQPKPPKLAEEVK